MSHLSDTLIHVCPVCKSNLFRIFLEDSDSNRINIICSTYSVEDKKEAHFYMCWLNNAFWFQTINIDRYRVIYDNKDGLSIRDGAVIVLTKHLSSHKEFVEINSLEKIQNLLLLS